MKLLENIQKLSLRRLSETCRKFATRPVIWVMIFPNDNFILCRPMLSRCNSANCTSTHSHNTWGLLIFPRWSALQCSSPAGFHHIAAVVRGAWGRLAAAILQCVHRSLHSPCQSSSPWLISQCRISRRGRGRQFLRTIFRLCLMHCTRWTLMLWYELNVALCLPEFLPKM